MSDVLGEQLVDTWMTSPKDQKTRMPVNLAKQLIRQNAEKLFTTTCPRIDLARNILVQTSKKS